MDDPKFELGQRIRVKKEAEEPGPPLTVRGELGAIEGYTGIFGSGSIETIQKQYHQYMVMIDGDATPFHLVNENWLEETNG